MTATSKWHPLELFDQRFLANLSALERRDPLLASRLRELKPTLPLFVTAEDDNVLLGRSGPIGVEVLPNPVPPAAARQIAGSLFRSPRMYDRAELPGVSFHVGTGGGE